MSTITASIPLSGDDKSSLYTRTHKGSFTVQGIDLAISSGLLLEAAGEVNQWSKGGNKVRIGSSGTAIESATASLHLL